MKITLLEETSTVGKTVFFNAQELIVLAGLVQELSQVIDHNSKVVYTEKGIEELCVSTHTLLSPITKGVKSLDETFKDLFIPKVDEKESKEVYTHDDQ